MIAVMLGPPGSGKGTQAQRLSEFYHCPQIASGDIFRALLRGQSELAGRVRAFVESGKLVPDEVTIEVVRERLERNDCQHGFILDGFPRTVEQAERLTGYLKAKNLKIDRIISLEVPDEVVVNRLSGRRTCQDCGSVYHLETHPPRVLGRCDRCNAQLIQRTDDEAQTIRERLAVYHRHTAPLIDYYRSKRLLHSINGTKDVDEITQTIRAVLDGDE